MRTMEDCLICGRRSGMRATEFYKEIHPPVYGGELGFTLTSTSEVENNAPSLAIARIR